MQSPGNLLGLVLVGVMTLLVIAGTLTYLLGVVFR